MSEVETWCRANVERPYAELHADLESYAALLRQWQPIQNLVSRETLGALWSRHFLDSLQLHILLKERDVTVLDIGSGGGFPALPLAIADKGSKRAYTLVEPNNRKAAFLRTVARTIGLDRVSVLTERAEGLDSRETAVDIITARALASLTTLCAHIHPLLRPSGRAILHKGREHVDELREAGANWRFDVIIHQSVTDESGVLLEISCLQPR